MKDRIKTIIEMSGLTYSKFAESIGVQPATISHIVTGRNKPGSDLITGILRRYPFLEPRWLLMGEGEFGTLALHKDDITPYSTSSSVYAENTFDFQLIADFDEQSKQSLNLNESDLASPSGPLDEQYTGWQRNDNSLSNASPEALKDGSVELKVEATKEEVITEQKKPQAAHESNYSHSIESSTKAIKNKNIHRIIIFYKDGSFEEYHNN